MEGITPCLWFDTQAEEAVAFYASLIEDSQIGEVVRYGEGAPLPAGIIRLFPFEGLLRRILLWRFWMATRWN